MAKSLTTLIARRYFFSKSNRNFINVITGISVGAVLVGSTAMIVILSVFNGMESLIRSLFDSFDPDLQISLVEGKSFEPSDEWLTAISEVEGVGLLTEVLEDNALLRYRDGQLVVTVKGVSESFLEQKQIEEALVQGEMKLREGSIRYAVVGRGIQYALGINTQNEFYALSFFYPKNVRPGAMLQPGGMYITKNISPGGVFAIEKQYDENYVFVPLDFAEELFQSEGTQKRTSVEVMVAKGHSVSAVKARLRRHLGEEFKVLDSEEQHSTILRALKSEKVIVFALLILVLAVASFNIFFSLSMMAIEKKKEIAVLFAMGATKRTVRGIFLLEGAIISFVGTTIGLAIGFLLVWSQQTFGFVKMGMTSAVVDDYPVKMEVMDFVIGAGSIILITLLASLRPAHIATRTQTLEHL